MSQKSLEVHSTLTDPFNWICWSFDRGNGKFQKKKGEGALIIINARGGTVPIASVCDDDADNNVVQQKKLNLK